MIVIAYNSFKRIKMQQNLVFLRFFSTEIAIHTELLPLIHTNASFIPTSFGSQNTQIEQRERKKNQTIKWVLDFRAKCNIVFLSSLGLITWNERWMK